MLEVSFTIWSSAAVVYKLHDLCISTFLSFVTHCNQSDDSTTSP
jgi:hypothetical protein